TQLKRQKKRKTKVADAGEPSHPAKKLRHNYGALGGPTFGGKSQSSIQRLLAGAVQNVKVKGGVMPTLPFVSSSVSITPEREGEDHTELLARANLRTIRAPRRFIISLDSSDYSGVNIAEAEVASVVRTLMPIITRAPLLLPPLAKEKLVGSSLFGADSPSTGESHPIPGCFSDCTGSDFLIGGIRTVMDPDFNLQKVCIPQWNVTNGSCLDYGDVCRKMVDEFAPPKFFCMSLSAEVRMHAKYNIRERKRLNSIVEEKDALLKAKDEELRSLKAQLTEKSGLDVTVDDLAASVKVREQEVADLDAIVTSVKLQNDNLVDQVHKLETSFAVLLKKVTTYENCLSQLEKFQDERMRDMNDKFDKLDIDLVEMALHLEESKAVEKGMHDGLYAGITHGAEELKSNKDASIETIMNLLRLEDSLAKKLALSVTDLMGTESTLNVIPTTVDTTTSLSVSPVSISLIPPISIDDYEAAHAKGEDSTGADVNPFLNVDDTELNIPQ
nr:hypothetical protein [Tanacetum cinerariifolium]